MNRLFGLNDEGFCLELFADQTMLACAMARPADVADSAPFASRFGHELYSPKK